MKQKAKASLKGGKTKELKVKTITKEEFSKNNKMKKTPAKMKKAPMKLTAAQKKLPAKLQAIIKKKEAE